MRIISERITGTHINHCSNVETCHYCLLPENVTHTIYATHTKTLHTHSSVLPSVFSSD